MAEKIPQPPPVKFGENKVLDLQNAISRGDAAVVNDILLDSPKLFLWLDLKKADKVLGMGVIRTHFEKFKLLNLLIEHRPLPYVRLLVDNYGVHVTTNRNAPLFAALMYNKVDIARYLIDKGADIKDALSGDEFYDVLEKTGPEAIELMLEEDGVTSQEILVALYELETGYGIIPKRKMDIIRVAVLSMVETGEIKLAAKREESGSMWSTFLWDSVSENIELEELEKPEKQWMFPHLDWKILSQRADPEFAYPKNKVFPWDWSVLTFNFNFTTDILPLLDEELSDLELYLDWSVLTAIAPVSGILSYPNYRWDWNRVSARITPSQLRSLEGEKEILEKLDWEVISMRISVHYVSNNTWLWGYLDWDLLSRRVSRLDREKYVTLPWKPVAEDTFGVVEIGGDVFPYYTTLESRSTGFRGTSPIIRAEMRYLLAKHNQCVWVNDPLKVREDDNEITVPPIFIRVTRKCKKRFVAFPVVTENWEGARPKAHMMMLLYDKQLRTLERFDPFPYITEFARSEKMLDSIPEIFSKEGIPVWKYYTPENTCYIDPFYVGLQHIQEAEKLAIPGDPTGFCAAWSFYYADARMSNPDVDPPVLRNRLLKFLHSRTSSFTSFIRGVAHFIAEREKRGL